MGLSLLFGLLVVVFFDLCNFLSETGTWYLFHNDFPNSYACVAYFIPLIISRLPAANTSGPSPGRWRRHQHIWQYHR